MASNKSATEDEYQHTIGDDVSWHMLQPGEASKPIDVNVIRITQIIKRWMYAGDTQYVDVAFLEAHNKLIERRGEDKIKITTTIVDYLKHQMAGFPNLCIQAKWGQRTVILQASASKKILKWIKIGINKCQASYLNRTKSLSPHHIKDYVLVQPKYVVFFASINLAHYVKLMVNCINPRNRG